MNTYLQFTSSDELLDFLKADGGAVHLDISEMHSDIGHGIALISIYAVLSHNAGDFIAVYGTLIHRVQDIEISGNDERAKAAREKFRSEIDERVTTLREKLETSGCGYKPGIWTHEAPRYLRKSL